MGLFCDPYFFRFARPIKIGPAFKLVSALNNTLCLAKWKQGDSCLGVGNLRRVLAALCLGQGGGPGSEL